MNKDNAPGDDFEQKLIALTRVLRDTAQPDPTPAWKHDILARAHREAAAARPPGPPRLLVAGWALAWAAIILLTLSTPRVPGAAASGPIAAAPGDQNPTLSTTPALIAFQRQYNTDLQ
jgi:hypothetical protein